MRILAIEAVWKCHNHVNSLYKNPSRFPEMLICGRLLEGGSGGQLAGFRCALLTQLAKKRLCGNVSFLAEQFDQRIFDV